VKGISKFSLAGLLLLALCGCHKDQGAIPVASREVAGCAGFLSAIVGAKEVWAKQSGAASNSTPTWDDLNRFFRRPPNCPGGGTYTIGTLEELPKCSIESHNAYFLTLHQLAQKQQQEEKQ
jgi:hypothetical protein